MFLFFFFFWEIESESLFSQWVNFYSVNITFSCKVWDLLFCLYGFWILCVCWCLFKCLDFLEMSNCPKPTRSKCLVTWSYFAWENNYILFCCGEIDFGRDACGVFTHFVYMISMQDFLSPHAATSLGKDGQIVPRVASQFFYKLFPVKRIRWISYL